jgi:hypothetical protein
MSIVAGSPLRVDCDSRLSRRSSNEIDAVTPVTRRASDIKVNNCILFYKSFHDKLLFERPPFLPQEIDHRQRQYLDLDYPAEHHVKYLLLLLILMLHLWIIFHTSKAIFYRHQTLQILFDLLKVS